MGRAAVFLVVLATVLVGRASASLSERDERDGLEFGGPAPKNTRLLPPQIPLARPAAFGATLNPGDAAPPLDLKTLVGTFTLGPDVLPAVFNVLRPESGFSQCLWECDASIDTLLTQSPNTTHWVFLSGSSSSSAVFSDVNGLCDRFMARMKALGFSQGTIANKLQHMHFVTEPLPPSVKDRREGSEWLPLLLSEWTTFNSFITVETPETGASVEIPRLDARYDWLGWAYNPSSVFGSKSIPVADFGTGCTKTHSSVVGKIALISRAGTCSYYEKIHYAFTSGAVGVIVYSTSDLPATDMTCSGFECNVPMNISATMVSFEHGNAIVTALQHGDEVSVKFSTVESPGTDLAVDANGRLRESWGGSGLGSGNTDGNPGDMASKLYPSMEFMVYAAKWLDFQSQLHQQLEKPATVVPVFAQEPMRPLDGNCYGTDPVLCGPSAVVEVPSDHLAYSTVELDYALSCASTRDISCPQWDHVIQLRMCCEPGCNAVDGHELGRWITSFGRGNGRWLTDVSPLNGLFSGKQCNMTIYTTPWGGNQGAIPWIATLNLRFSEKASEQSGVLIPRVTLNPWKDVTTSDNGISMVYRWTFFNQTYWDRFPAFHFDVPADAKKVKLVTVVTGHGNDNHGCGEFCATEHRWIVNKGINQQKLMLPETNQELGCASEVNLGTTPNEYGTWLYGRDGWCDGRDVTPWVVDVTDQVTKNGENVLRYEGLYQGHAPNPGPPDTWSQAEPDMMVSTYVVMFFESQL